MAREFTDLSASGQTEWLQIFGPQAIRLKGTWIGSVQVQIRGKDAGSAESNLGEALTANDVKLVNIPAHVTAEVRIDFTRTSGTLESEIM
ncbi:MAG: hypothetical protein AAGK93_00120 [Pseudomonadota bacterium]